MNSEPSQKQAHYQAVLGNVARAGVYHLPPASRDEIIAAAEASAYVVFRVDLGKARDQETLLAAIGRDMAFPEWFGYNWDALADSLGDLGWRPAEGYLVVLEHCDRMHARANDDLITALHVFEAAATEWRERGVALWCLVDMHADGIAWLPGL